MTKEMQNTNYDDSSESTTQRTLVPKVDVQELADSFVVRLDIPGAEKESIVARVIDATLTVTANVQALFKRDAITMSDDLPAEYRREFSLADNIDPQSIEAVYDLGVLRITLKKKQQYLPKEIKIQ
jgi:HSP20 family protein